MIFTKNHAKFVFYFTTLPRVSPVANEIWSSWDHLQLSSKK